MNNEMYVDQAEACVEEDRLERFPEKNLSEYVAPAVADEGSCASGMLVLADGTVTLVSPEDCPALSEFNWSRGSHGNGRMYVYRYETKNGSKKKIYLHRQIISAGKGEKVDHVNGDPLDNRRSNLRITTSKGNAQNRRKVRSYKNKNPSSPYKGVHWNRGKYRASICADGKRYHLGCFTDPGSAAVAYDRAALDLFGEFALTNFSDQEGNRPSLLGERSSHVTYAMAS